MLVLSLEHFGNCCRLLRPGSSRELSDGMRTFRDEWKKTADLRDALEHEEEYLAGRGSRRERIIGDRWDPDGGSYSNGFAYRDDGLQTFYLLGRDYDLQHAIRAALAIGPLVARAFTGTSGPR